MDIDPAGNIGAVIDTFEFDISNGEEPSIIRVSNGIYAIAYSGLFRDGKVITLPIDPTGNIGAIIDTLTFEPITARLSKIIQVSSDIFAIAYRLNTVEGFVKTLRIDATGDIDQTQGGGTGIIDTLQFDTRALLFDILNVVGNTYAVVHTGQDNDGFLTTLDIDPAGNIGAVIDSLEFDLTDGFFPDIENVADDIFAIAYRGLGNVGFLKTVSIDATGSIGKLQQTATSIRFLALASMFKPTALVTGQFGGLC